MTLGELTERPTICESASGYLIARVAGQDYMLRCPDCHDPLQEWGMVTSTDELVPRRFYCCTCHKGGSSADLVLIPQDHAECFPEDTVAGPFDRNRFLELARQVNEALGEIEQANHSETLFRAVGRALERGSHALLYARRIVEPDQQAAVVAAHRACLTAVRQFREVLEWRGMEP